MVHDSDYYECDTFAQDREQGRGDVAEKQFDRKDWHGEVNHRRIQNGAAELRVQGVGLFLKSDRGI